MRSLPEWQGSTPDAAVPARVRLRIFERFNGRCLCGCGIKIAPGMKWELDHVTALINGGEHREYNLRPLLKEHHKRKSKDDVAIKSYNYRRKLAHAGIKRRKSRPIPGNRDSGWKITFSRGAVRR
jgi:5-methylcytosine-specific restriction protein A